MIILLLFSITIITLIAENNFYTKNTNYTEKKTFSNEDILENSALENEKKSSEQEKTRTYPKNSDKTNEFLKSADDLEKKSPEPSEEELNKIINERKEQVKNNSKSIEDNSIQEIPEIISLTLAQIISENKLDNKNFSLETYEEKTWSSTALGCPKNGMMYAQVITEGYILRVLNHGEIEQYNADTNGNFINCSEINKSNLGSDFNFVKKYNLFETEKISLYINNNNNLVSSIEDKEEISIIIDRLDIEIEVETTDKCEANYKLVFEKKSPNTEMFVYCQNNPYYVEIEQSISAGKSILGIVEKILTTMEFPGMPQ
ncbi:MAG: hypothetical protein CL773_00450 [Chloroflexi bacterium]|nr:hypothetical protein [Chloroflexota bacterium]|tara:strand:+ start:8159 stop:9106 length:948 start_codon:yes stop_codon:yes gene_type:complete